MSFREALEDVVASAAMRLPEPLMSRLLGDRRVVIGGNTLDVHAQFLLRLIAAAGQPELNELSHEQARALFNRQASSLGPERCYMASVTDRRVPGATGEIPVRVYVPSLEERPLPATVYYHGGGFVIGNVETHDGVARKLAHDSGCIVVSVDYRLAPEHKYPAAPEDALAAFRWAVGEAAELGIDTSRVAVAGDSAGGNLAAVTAIAARDGGHASPCFQLLIYPVTDLACDSESYEAFADGFYLTRNMMLWFRDHYLGAGASLDDPLVSPLRCEDLAGLPSAFVLTSGFDVLRDEGIAYAERLSAAGISVSQRCYGSLIHGFVSLVGAVPAARVAFDDATAALRLAFSRVG